MNLEMNPTEYRLGNTEILLRYREWGKFVAGWIVSNGSSIMHPEHNCFIYPNDDSDLRACVFKSSSAAWNAFDNWLLKHKESTLFYYPERTKTEPARMLMGLEPESMEAWRTRLKDVILDI